jgi:hypothetical protein
MAEKKPVQLQIKVEEAVGQGEYANFLSILHNPTEFVLDFGRVMPGVPEVRVKSRILTTPYHAKRFLETLPTGRSGPISVPRRPPCRPP